MRGRGLKLARENKHAVLQTVAPHAGAWIETVYEEIITKKKASPPMRGRGLKLIVELAFYRKFSRPPCGGVD